MRAQGHDLARAIYISPKRKRATNEKSLKKDTKRNKEG